MARSQIEEFYDEAYELDGHSLDSWSNREFCVAKMDTLVFHWKATLWAVQIPRRLGGGATARELSADKKFMRMVSHLCGQLHGGWGRVIGDNVPVDLGSYGPAEKRFGAQIDNEDFMRELTHVAEAQRKSICTIAMQLGMPRIAEKVLPLFSQELSNLERIRSKYEETLAR